MKEIKFRVWHKKKKGIFEVDSLHSLQFKETLWVSPAYYHKHDNAWNHEDIELMQFTGLHDKNGKEIWEGDIAMNKWRGGPIIIYFSNGAFRGQYQYIPLAEANGFIFDSGEAKECEIIGNIYENPELLFNEKSTISQKTSVENLKKSEHGADNGYKELFKILTTHED